MKTPPLSLSLLRRGFTLIELLVVIVIIAILVSLAVPATNLVMKRAQDLKIKTVLKDLQVAIGHYRTEYNRFPINPDDLGGGDSDIEPFLTDGTSQPMVNILTANVDSSGASTNMNPKAIKFIDLPSAKNNLFGIIDPSGGANDGTPVQLVDTWGLPYKVLLDTNYDNRIQNPDKSNNDQRISTDAPEYLNSTSAIYSFGPDRQEFTKDDIVSWR
ncbi:prepilin-type N-terminal cleavage/methylation domain-containing protein [Prosthecobacter debontii]|uniref:Prepilin-type N-terminal cleavage/methylation domain-containing protein n=1 Tax=Prosthecobacter debontii TaxID=48467 RepID=A0A1T4YD74_9BACT|nr:prepilin-type N-terminal cleavage/methylation domain-containing protein [Prosthecobacter debontii]SKA99777.1 prepilin-type N-terminal cleavage/methylation domain-containing protein [Prosthecobacter debontii]